jgi:hypothetical protein
MTIKEIILENIKWIFSGVGVVILVALWSIFRKKTTKSNNNLSDSSNVKRIKRPPKRIDSKVIIDTVYDENNDPYIEYSVYVRRCWYPNKKANVKEFINELSLENPICFECKTPFISSSTVHFFKECTGINCSLRDNRMWKSSSDFNKIIGGRVVLNNYKGKIIKDSKLFEALWSKYEKWYNNFTNRKVKEYARPLRLS